MGFPVILRGQQLPLPVRPYGSGIGVLHTDGQDALLHPHGERHPPVPFRQALHRLQGIVQETAQDDAQVRGIKSKLRGDLQPAVHRHTVPEGRGIFIIDECIQGQVPAVDSLLAARHVLIEHPPDHAFRLCTASFPYQRLERHKPGGKVMAQGPGLAVGGLPLRSLPDAGADLLGVDAVLPFRERVRAHLPIDIKGHMVDQDHDARYGREGNAGASRAGKAVGDVYDEDGTGRHQDDLCPETPWQRQRAVTGIEAAAQLYHEEDADLGDDVSHVKEVLPAGACSKQKILGYDLRRHPGNAEDTGMEEGLPGPHAAGDGMQGRYEADIGGKDQQGMGGTGSHGQVLGGRIHPPYKA